MSSKAFGSRVRPEDSSGQPPAPPGAAPRKLVRRAWAPALLWLAVVAWESTPLGSSQETGRFLYPIIALFDPHITMAQFAILHSALRKAGHFIGYAVLSLLMLRAWWSTLMLPGWATRLPSWEAMLRSWRARAAAIALLSAIAVAALDELHQSMIPGRTSSIHDVALDTMAQFAILHSALRKAGHFIGYAVLSLLMLRAWWSTLMLPGWATRLPSWEAMLRSWRARAAAIALLSAIAVAALDELHQSMIPGRTSSIHDVALDTMAAACAQLILIAFSDALGRNAALGASLVADSRRRVGG